ncbi:hypothetical protein CLOP_g2099 [Closterium sp. NIES-67]|nr:hypothetical protein CLOP_g2099 [Closterium sp. NIES-67]
MAGLVQIASVSTAARVPASLNAISSDLSGSRLASIAPSRARVQCGVTYAPPSTARLELLREAEERFARVERQPTEGVAFTALEFEEALEKYDFNFDIGDKVRGVVFKADNAGALIDIGAKAPALLPLAEACLFRLKNMSDTGLVPGMEAEFVVVDEDDSQGRMIVSLRKLQYDLAWERCRQLVADDVTVRGTVIAVNRGGLLVEVEGCEGFVPLSQIGLRAAKEIWWARASAQVPRGRRGAHAPRALQPPRRRRLARAVAAGGRRGGGARAVAEAVRRVRGDRRP